MLNIYFCFFSLSTLRAVRAHASFRRRNSLHQSRRILNEARATLIQQHHAKTTHSRRKNTPQEVRTCPCEFTLVLLRQLLVLVSTVTKISHRVDVERILTLAYNVLARFLACVGNTTVHLFAIEHYREHHRIFHIFHLMPHERHGRGHLQNRICKCS